ncbi:CBS domain-containing protein [Mesorhizobium sp. GbtcB19]|uniref:CBS domain-containing protein n=1 Tax=Mesorhizobium sp. GbtcB19 TaxID=2824764 RepID=UPI001C310A64|nr:CBS domain-containing protein [Mesorhizobium sp. GbtcB19]
MSNPTEGFIRTFEEIVREVNSRAGSPSSHSFEVERASERDGTVKKNRALLVYIRDVRNALQHPKHRSDGNAIEISEGFLDEVRGLLNHLRNPPTANSVGVPRKEIRTASLSDQLGDLADEMKRRGFSHLPIVDERDAVIGVFNEAAVFNYLWGEQETIVGRDMRISDILSSCRLDASRMELFKFVTPRTALEDLVQIFLSVQSPLTRVGAAFVTAAGKESEPLQRLITPWDVLATFDL